MPELLALLDLGSNAARFVLARIDPGRGYRVLQKERIQTRLGDGRAGELPPEAVTLTLSAVGGFLDRLGTTGAPPRLLAVATAAVRDAPNRDALLRVLRERHRAEVRMLGDREEAHLGAQAALRRLPIRDGVVLDLGGGSLQLSRIRAGVIASAASAPIGAVRMTRRFLRGDPPPPREMRALRAEVREHLLGVLPEARPHDALLGLGGTVRTLARIHLALRGGGRRKRHALDLALEDVMSLRERLEALPVRKRRRIAGLKAERADIILAGAATVEEVMRFGGYRALTVCKGGVRDSILWEETFAEREALVARG
jgi:exopolyphosphatase / guanosine-5'-triphosphate,3'-diphosphate pyrophosphatase